MLVGDTNGGVSVYLLSNFPPSPINQVDDNNYHTSLEFVVVVVIGGSPLCSHLLNVKKRNLERQ